jgi:hypothetical protein
MKHIFLTIGKIVDPLYIFQEIKFSWDFYFTSERAWQQNGYRLKQDWKSFQSLPASIILVYCIGSNMG